MKTRSFVLAGLGTAALSGMAYALGMLSVVFLIGPLLACALAVGFPGAYPDFDKTGDAALREVWRKRALRIALFLGTTCTLAFGVLTWEHLSWPDRGFFFVVLQAPLLMSMIYQGQYLCFAWSCRRLPARVWPMRIIAIIIGGMFGVMLVPVQIDIAEQWFQNRQKPLLARLDATPDRCAEFKQYLAENPPDTAFATPDLYHGVVENQYDGQPLYVLGYRARADMESLIVHYSSGSRKWIATSRDNPRGMQDFTQQIAPLTRCDGPGEPIVSVRTG